MIQQALSQVLCPYWTPASRECSFGFRPRRSAHQAIKHAQPDIAKGHEWAVDLDPIAFFDRVQIDALMARVARQVTDERVLKLIRSYLEAGVMADGVKQPTERGAPQGSPLSLLLSNVYLDDLDQMLEKQGHRFVRYADDITIYVASKRAAGRVMQSTCEFIERRLKLPVNRGKSSAGPAFAATLLGFGFLKRKGEIKIRIDPKARHRAKMRRGAGCLSPRCLAHRRYRGPMRADLRTRQTTRAQDWRTQFAGEIHGDFTMPRQYSKVIDP
jgi:group II intron reverse transcriptase/maturase